MGSTLSHHLPLLRCTGFVRASGGSLNHSDPPDPAPDFFRLDVKLPVEFDCLKAYYLPLRCRRAKQSKLAHSSRSRTGTSKALARRFRVSTVGFFLTPVSSMAM